VEINHDKIEKLSGTTDVELGERIDKAVEEFERLQEELEQIEDDTDEIKTTQAERLREQLDQYADLESRVIDALVSEREKEIEAMKAKIAALEADRVELANKYKEETGEEIE
jgi:DNA repair exonuclease SbcCD ATPase subunit